MQKHICKAIGSKRLEIRVCEIYKRCRLVPWAPGNNARRGIPRSRRVVGCKAVQTYSLPPLLLRGVGPIQAAGGPRVQLIPPISVVLIIQTIFDFLLLQLNQGPSTLFIFNATHHKPGWKS